MKKVGCGLVDSQGSNTPNDKLNDILVWINDHTNHSIHARYG